MIRQLALTPSTVAVMVAVPFLYAVMIPLDETVATDGFEELHTGRIPLEVVATMEAEAFGVSVRVVLLNSRQGVFTVTVQEAELPSAEAMMTALPGRFPVTTPVVLTVAIVGSLDLHVILE